VNQLRLQLRIQSIEVFEQQRWSVSWIVSYTKRFEGAA
jgi:hypothetical protein